MVSQESVLAVKGFFSKQAGFIAREMADDYGIDLEAELILPVERTASAWSFPIQIKSSQKIEIITYDSQQFISLPFLTSRLGYLCRRIPAYGLVVIFDGGSKNCFFDYVENIIARITAQRTNDDWKLQESVNINIPIDQFLTENEVKGISQKFIRRFENCASLIHKHGGEFEIPSLFNTQKDQNDLNTPEKISEFLESYGSVLFNRQDYLLIDHLLSKLSSSQIAQSPRLLFTAALTYEGIGKYIDAQYYLSKCKQQENQYSQEEVALLKIIKSEIDYVFGNLSSEEYARRLEQVSNQLGDSEFKITVKGKLIHLKIGRESLKDENFKKLFLEIQELIESVEKSNLSETMKHNYKVSLATDLLLIFSALQNRLTGEIKIREKVFKNVSVQERLDAACILFPIFKVANDIYDKSLEYAINEKNKALAAYIYYGSGLTAFISGSVSQHKHWKMGDYEDTFKRLILAHNYFIENHRLHNAYKALTTAYDVNKLCQLHLKADIAGADKNKIESVMERLEREAGLPKYASKIEKTYKEVEKINNTPPDVQLKKMSRDEIEKYVTDLVRISRIPAERKPNLLADMIFNSEAAKALDGSRFIVLQNLNHTKSIETIYASPLKYILQCQGCGFTTPEGNELNELLAHKAVGHPHICL